MVKIVFHGNKPMWVGLFVAIAGGLMMLTHATILRDMEWMFSTGFAVMIVGALIYWAGRAVQIFKKRY